MITISSLLFSDGMVLQQGVSIPLAGTAAPEAEVEVTLSGEKYKTGADKNGAWRVLLNSQSAGGPHSMQIKTFDETLTLQDIYFGDVWVCSGQSNMEMLMERVKDNFPEEWEKNINPLIRQFKVPQEWDFSGPRGNFSGGQWTPATAETLHEFSAAAWFFAQALTAKHPAPIGLINSAWGGTPVESWMSREALSGGDAGAAFPEKIACGDQYNNPALRDQIAHNSSADIKAWNDELNSGDIGLTRNCCSDQNWYTDGVMELPGDFSEAGLKDFCGSVWLCREFDADETFAVAQDVKLWLGTIVDVDAVSVNGMEVGTTGYRYPPRKYPIPAGLLHKGKNQIVIRVICNNGEGGITRDKPFKFFTGDAAIELKGSWQYRIGFKMPRPCPQEFFFQRQPMCLFNAMIAPLLAYPCKGVIWYQGESNDPNPGEYAALFTAFINDWRKKKGDAAMPFLFVQLPIWGEPAENNENASWAIIREAQASALSLPAAGMAAALDLGEWNDIHPMDKKGIGFRLALAAEKVVYHEGNTSPGPQLRDSSLRDGKLSLHFDNCGSGLTAREQPFVSVIAGNESYRLPAVIEGPDCITVDVSAVANPEKVLYAWAGNPRDRSLYNADGLPVIPFRKVL